MAVTAALWTRGRAYLPGVALYLPEEWLTDAARATARVPATVQFQEKWRLALTLGIFGDVFNATNQGAPNSPYLFAVVDVSGQNFGQPGAWIDPRTIRAGARLMF